VNGYLVVPQETDFIVPVCVLCKRLPDSQAARRILADLIVTTERFDHTLAPYAPIRIW